MSQIKIINQLARELKVISIKFVDKFQFVT